jgi:hypothetical protein
MVNVDVTHALVILPFRSRRLRHQADIARPFAAC